MLFFSHFADEKLCVLVPNPVYLVFLRYSFLLLLPTAYKYNM